MLSCKIAQAQATEFFQSGKISPILGLGQENFTFEVADFGVNGRTIKFEPNIAGVVRLGVNAFGFGVGYSLRGSGKDIDSQKGHTEFSDWQLGYQAKNWGIDGFYQVYDGFYTSNTANVQLYPNTSFRHFGFTARYSFGDEEFSVGGLTDQSEEVRETSGKYYLVGGVHEHQLASDSPLLQQEYSGVNPTLEGLRNLKALSVNFGGGAGKYWVNESGFFIGGLFDLIGTYANYYYLSTAPGSRKDSDLTFSFNAKIGAGYSGQIFKSGFSLSSDVTRLKAPGDGVIISSANRMIIYLRMLF